MLQAVANLAPRGVYVCGNTTSAAGLTVRWIMNYRKEWIKLNGLRKRFIEARPAKKATSYPGSYLRSLPRPPPPPSLVTRLQRKHIRSQIKASCLF